MDEAFGNQPAGFVLPPLGQIANALSKGADVDLQAVNGAIAMV